MFKWQNVLAATLTVMGAIGFKWSDSIGASFQAIRVGISSNKLLTSAVTEKARQSILSSDPEVLFVELLSIGLFTTGVIWLTRRAGRQQARAGFFKKKERINVKDEINNAQRSFAFLQVSRKYNC